jgi:hypothetical protein
LAREDEPAGIVGIVIGFLSMFVYTGLVIALCKDPVAKENIFHKAHTGPDALTSNLYYGLFWIDLII